MGGLRVPDAALSPCREIQSRSPSSLGLSARLQPNPRPRAPRLPQAATAPPAGTAQPATPATSAAQPSGSSAAPSIGARSQSAGAQPPQPVPSTPNPATDSPAAKPLEFSSDDVARLRAVAGKRVTVIVRGTMTRVDARGTLLFPRRPNRHSGQCDRPSTFRQVDRKARRHNNYESFSDQRPGPGDARGAQRG